MRTSWFVVIESMGAWWVDNEGRSFGPLENRVEAISYAKKIAETYGDPLRRCDVWVRDETGEMTIIWSGAAPKRAG